jgi:hypothetical protein
MALMKSLRNLAILSIMVVGVAVGYAGPNPTGFPLCCTGIASTDYPCKDPSGGTAPWARSQCLYGCATHCLPGDPPDYTDFAYLLCRQGCMQY